MSKTSICRCVLSNIRDLGQASDKRRKPVSFIWCDVGWPSNWSRRFSMRSIVCNQRGVDFGSDAQFWSWYAKGEIRPRRKYFVRFNIKHTVHEALGRFLALNYFGHFPFPLLPLATSLPLCLYGRIFTSGVRPRIWSGRRYHTCPFSLLLSLSTFLLGHSACPRYTLLLSRPTTRLMSTSKP